MDTLCSAHAESMGRIATDISEIRQDMREVRQEMRTLAASSQAQIVDLIEANGQQKEKVAEVSGRVYVLCAAIGGASSTIISVLVNHLMRR